VRPEKPLVGKSISSKFPIACCRSWGAVVLPPTGCCGGIYEYLDGISREHWDDDRVLRDAVL